MKKIVLILGIVFATTFSFANGSVDNTKMEEYSDCYYQALGAAVASGAEYGSPDWQREFYLEYHYCRML